MDYAAEEDGVGSLLDTFLVRRDDAAIALADFRSEVRRARALLAETRGLMLQLELAHADHAAGASWRGRLPTRAARRSDRRR